MGSKKTKTTSVTVSTPQNPAWVESGVSDMMNRSSTLGAGDPHQFVPGANAYQIDAADRAREMSQVIAPQVKAESLLDGLDRYKSPYEKDVVNAAMSDFDTQASRTRAAQELQLAGAGAFGGSGAAIAKSLTEGELARGRNTQVANLLDQMFTRSAALSGEDAGRRQEASLANAQLQAGARDQELAALDLMGRRGDALRQADYERAQAPLNLTSWEAAVQAGLPLSLFSGNTTSSNGTQKVGASALETLQQAAQVAAAVAVSDGRLKEGVRTIGYDHKGRRWVSFRYHWDAPDVVRQGVIAQEVAATDPHAVVEHEDGYLMVDYAELH